MRLSGWTVCALACLCACSRGKPQAPPQAAQAGAPVVAVADVAQRTVPIYGEFVGQTEAANTVEIRSQVTGFLQQIAFTEGSIVQKGQLLFVIDPRSYAAALEQAKASVAQREAALAKAQQDVRRYRPLVAQHAISREQLDTAIAQEKQERANVEAARAQVAQAKLNLDYTRIAAPLTGQIGAAQVKIGALVQAGTTLLDTIYSISPMYVTFSVSEQRHLEYAKRNAKNPSAPPPLELILADGSTYPYKGRINMVAPQVNPSTGTLALRGEFPNPDGLLKPGLFVRVRVLIDERKNATVVPHQAIQEVQGVSSVLVVGSDSKVSMHTVQTGPTVDNLTVIESGVKPGERVIVAGAQKVRPGMQVAAEAAQPGQQAAQAAQPGQQNAPPQQAAGTETSQPAGGTANAPQNAQPPGAPPPSQPAPAGRAPQPTPR